MKGVLPKLFYQPDLAFEPGAACSVPPVPLGFNDPISPENPGPLWLPLGPDSGIPDFVCSRSSMSDGVGAPVANGPVQ